MKGGDQMKRNFILVLAALLFTSLVFSRAFAVGETKKAAKEVTITGQVIDPACYMKMNQKGPEHKKCAQTCAKSGQTLAILEDKTNKIYISLADEMGGDPNAQILDLAEEHVKVTGKVITKGGLSGIVISKVEKLGAPGAK